MKNLKTLAAKYNYYTIDTIPEHIMNDPYFAAKIEYEKRKLQNNTVSDSLKTCKDMETGIFVKIREQFSNNTNDHELYYVEHSSILVYHQDASSLLQVLTYKGKQYLHPAFEVTLNFNVSYDQQRDFMIKLNKPNYVGLWTDRKVTDWVQYCNGYCNALQACADSLSSQRSANELKIKGTIESLPGAKVHTTGNYTSIDTRLFRIDFTLEDNGAYLQTKVQYRGTLEDIIQMQL